MIAGIVGVLSANWGRLLVGGTILAALTYVAFKLKVVLQIGAAKRDAVPLGNPAMEKAAIAYLVKHAGPTVKRVGDLNQAYKNNELTIKILPQKLMEGIGEGTTTQGTNDIYIGQNIVESHDRAAFALALFGEFQHSKVGGGALDNPEIQKELEAVRRTFPQKDRTRRVNSIVHGGQENHP